MNYYKAKKKILRKRAAGLVLVTACGLVLIVSLLKFLYFGLDDGGPLLANLRVYLKNVVSHIYAHTQFLMPLWKHAPVPDLQNPWSRDMTMFMSAYIFLLIGTGIFRSGQRLSRRLKKIEEKIEDEMISASMRGQSDYSKEKLRANLNLPEQSAWKEFRTSYAAPLIVGLILLFVGKAIGA